MDFWPDDLIIQDNAKPEQVLEDVKRELDSLGVGVHALIETQTMDDRIAMAFTLENDKKDKVKLFDVLSVPDLVYPVAIEPITRDLPAFLRREKVVTVSPMIPDLESMIRPRQKTITNYWICSSAPELRRKIRELLADDYVKSRIRTLIAMISE